MVSKHNLRSTPTKLFDLKRSIKTATDRIRQIPQGKWAVVYGHHVYAVPDVYVPEPFRPMYKVDAWGNVLLNESQAAGACLFRLTARQAKEEGRRCYLDR